MFAVLVIRGNVPIVHSTTLPQKVVLVRVTAWFQGVFGINTASINTTSNIWRL